MRAPLPKRLAVSAVERPWGGHGLPALGLIAPGSKAIGEYWLPTDEFPLLVKIIDARDRLSIQLHPDDATARTLGLPSGKTECWYILDAKPNAKLWLGLADGVAPEQFLSRAERGEDVSTALVEFVPTAGEIYYVPAGTVHAIGSGVTVLEVQQPADVTLRVFDWNRQPPRPLHLAEARIAIRGRTAARRIPPLAPPVPPENQAEDRLTTEFFSLRELCLVRAGRFEARTSDPEVWFVRSGRGSLVLGDANPGRCEVTPGAFLLMPAGAGSLHWEPASDLPDATCRIVRMACR